MWCILKNVVLVSILNYELCHIPLNMCPFDKKDYERPTNRVDAPISVF